MKKNIFFSLLFTGICLQIIAQDTLQMNLKKAILMGMDSSHQLKISAAKLELAQARYHQAQDATIPSVRLYGNYTRLSNIDMPKIQFPGSAEPFSLFPVYVNNYSAGLSLSETVFSGFRLKFAKESQKLLLNASGYDLEKDKEEMAFNIVSAYMNLYKIQSSLRLIVENLKQVKERVRETVSAENNGLATHNDVLRWQLQESNIELTGIDLRNNLEVANYNFSLMLGLARTVVILPDSNDVNSINTLLTLEEYFNKATSSRPDLFAADMRNKAMYNNLRVAQNSDLPRISIGADYLDARPNTRFIPPIDAFRQTWSLGLFLNWDLVSLYSNRHNVDEARSIYRQSTENYAMLSDAIKSEINQSYIGYKQTLDRINLIGKSVEQAEENYRLMDSRYKNDLANLSDLLEASTILLNAHINLELAKADRQIAYYRLQKSVSAIAKNTIY